MNYYYVIIKYDKTVSGVTTSNVFVAKRFAKDKGQAIAYATQIFNNLSNFIDYENVTAGVPWFVITEVDAVDIYV